MGRAYRCLLEVLYRKGLFFDLLLLKKQIEDDIDKLILEYKLLKDEGKDKEAKLIFQQVLMSQLHLSMEGIPLQKDVSDKIYRVFR